MEKEIIIQLETVIDHLSGEEIGAVLEILNASTDVLDAIFLTGIGKKNRPCGLLQVLCRPVAEEKVAALIFRHTHSLGIRRMNAERYVLPRCTEEIYMDQEKVSAKQYILEGETYKRPEADALRALAAKTGKGMPSFRFQKK